ETALEEKTIIGKVLNDANDEPIEGVHVVNLNKVVGTTTSEQGDFSIHAQVNDTLYFSYLGFKSIRVRVTNDWMRYGDIKINMPAFVMALDEVVVRPVQLTGYVQVDAKTIAIYDNSRCSISGLNTGYEGGNGPAGAVGKVLSAVFNPADFLYNVFG